MARILVVDDENNIRMMMRLVLQHVGHVVESASDGLEGLEKFGDGDAFDLVLLDQRMPGMEGLDVLREMRKRNVLTKIVMATAFGTIDLAIEAMKEGATDFLRKPFTAEMLRGALQSALGESSVNRKDSSGITFASTTINGFRIEFSANGGERTNVGFRQNFTIRDPDGKSASCTVILSSEVMKLVKNESLNQLPESNDRFWQAMCDEALANHLWQNAEFPVGDELRVDELTNGMRRFVELALKA